MYTYNYNYICAQNYGENIYFKILLFFSGDYLLDGAL